VKKLSSINIDQKALARIQKKLGSIEKFTQEADAPMKDTVDLVLRVVQKQPPKAQGAFSRLATPKQRRAYWAGVSSGRIPHGPGGYQRTGKLRQKWTREVKPVSNGVRGEVGNNADHAIFVHGWRQQPFHSVTGYKKTDVVIEEQKKNILRIWQRWAKKILSR
jgi:hypothetical protein